MSSSMFGTHKVVTILLMVQKSGVHLLRLVVYPVIYKVLDGFSIIPGGCLGFLNHQQYHTNSRYLSLVGPTGSTRLKPILSCPMPRDHDWPWPWHNGPLFNRPGVQGVGLRVENGAIYPST